MKNIFKSVKGFLLFTVRLVSKLWKSDHDLVYFPLDSDGVKLRKNSPKIADNLLSQEGIAANQVQNEHSWKEKKTLGGRLPLTIRPHMGQR